MPELDNTKVPDTYWNYRIIAEYLKEHTTWHFTIRDVYYKNGVPTGWGADPQFCSGETHDELTQDMLAMLKAGEKEILVVDDDGEKLIPMSQYDKRFVPLQ